MNEAVSKNKKPADHLIFYGFTINTFLIENEKGKI